MSLTIASLFAGCGGLDLGFLQLGAELRYACDSSPHAVACYRHNLGDHCVQRDVRSGDFDADLETIGPVDLVLGGFPCQGFSKAGPKRRGDARNLLYRRMQDAVLALKPRAFVAENVDGIQQNFGGEFVRRVQSGFTSDAVAYDVSYRVLDAAHYGVPQHRRRAFFVGLRADLGARLAWPAPTHQPRTRSGEFRVAADAAGDLPPPRTVRDAIGDLVSLDEDTPDHRVTRRWPEQYAHIFRAVGPGQKLCNVRHAPTSVYTWQIPEVFGPTTDRQRLLLETLGRHRRHKRYGRIPNGNPIPVEELARLSGLDEATVRQEAEALTAAGYLKPRGGGYDLKGAMFCSGLFKRPPWDAPAPTVLTNLHNPRYFLHPSEDRPLSLRECARLQSFPDDFGFLASGIPLVEGYRLVGNAVPPRLSRAIAGAVLRALGHSMVMVPVMLDSPTASRSASPSTVVTLGLSERVRSP
jgi:DNA (cytosine-5)-methyltransferase 1